MLDRRVESELYQLERDLADRAQRLAEQTRVVLLRRLGRLPAAHFEAVVRTLLGRLGLVQIELVKRGEGVAYFGAERREGRQRILVSMRPGDVELSRRAVGELRAGLKLRNYDEGILLTPGRAGAEALTELQAAGGAVELHDGMKLVRLCVQELVGVVRRTVTADVLDVDFFAELQDGHGVG